MDFTATIPDETLSHIYSYIRSMEPPYSVPPPEPPSDSDDTMSTSEWGGYMLGWVKVTFVDRRWRRVAIDDALLWTCPDFRLGPRWADEFARRSKSASLIVDDRYMWAGKALNRMALANIVAAHHARISHLGIEALFNVDSFNFNNLISSYVFGRLKTINITVGVQSRVTSLNTLGRSCNSLLEHTTRVRYLTLDLPGVSYAHFNWKNMHLSRLISLDLSGQTATLLSPQFLDALRQMDLLALLSISDSDDSLQHTIPLSCNHRCSGSHEDAIRLKNVRVLNISGPMEFQTHLLRHIRSPHARLTVTTHFQHRSRPVELPTYEAFAHELNKFFQHHSQVSSFSSAHLYLSVRTSDITAVELRLKNAQPSRAKNGTPVSVRKARDALHNYSFRATLQDCDRTPIAMSIIPIHDIRFLTLHDAGLSCQKAYLSFFPHVERLSLRVEWDHQSSMHGIHLLEDTALLPSLRFVDLCGPPYTKISAILTYVIRHEPNVVPTRLAALEDVLQARLSAGKPLQAFYLHIAQEVALVRAGRIGETSCRDLREEIVLEFIQKMEAVRGVQIVDKDFDIFAM